MSNVAISLKCAERSLQRSKLLSDILADGNITELRAAIDNPQGTIKP